jgi:two-component system, OmpR family, phosphate regulon sensor histidine kinase PhoR
MLDRLDCQPISPPSCEIEKFRETSIASLLEELRTPLANIKTALQLLESPSLKTLQRQRYIDLIREECNRQTALIGKTIDLLELDLPLSGGKSGSAQPIEVLPGIVSMFQPIAAERGINLGYRVAANLAAVACSEAWLKRMAIETIDNAIRHTNPGGQIFVEVSAHAKGVKLEITDTGIGIAPTEIPKIFDRFYQVRNKTNFHHSAGLGLTIVRHLLHSCGGSISVTSTLNQGSIFRLVLPQLAISPAG